MPAAYASTKVTNLEHKLQRKLNFSCDALRATDSPEARITGRERLAISSVGPPQAHVVEEIVEFAPELKDLTLAVQGEVFE